MKRTALLTATAAFAMVAFVASVSVANATMSQSAQKCRASLQKNAGKVVKAVEKGIGKCFKDAQKALQNGSNCYTPAGYDTAGKVHGVKGAFDKLIAAAAKCDPAAEGEVVGLYGSSCPSPGTVGSVTDYTSLHTCVAQIAENATVGYYQDLVGSPANALSKTEGTCQATLLKGLSKYIDAQIKESGKCQSTAEKDAVKLGNPDPAYIACDKADPKLKVYGSPKGKLPKFKDSINGALSGKPKCLSPADVAALGGRAQTPDELVSLIDGSGTPGLSGVANPDFEGYAVAAARGLSEAGWQAGPGPVTANVFIATGSQGGNTRLDSGSSGLGYDVDLPQGFQGAVDLDCSGSPDRSACAVSVSGRFDGCRCSDNHTAHCTEPFTTNAASCGGTGDCECFFGPPLPLNAGGTPVCVVNQMQSVNGTANIGTGESSTLVAQRSFLYTGIGQNQPCPTCDGGTCNGGADNGSSCTVDSTHPNFGDLSYDCRPAGAASAGNLGITLQLADASSTMSTTTDQVGCTSNALGKPCHCSICSGDSGRACNTDADCSAFGAGTCTGGSGHPRARNACGSDAYVCNAAPGEAGTCPTISTDFCDGFVRPNGDGIITCTSNADCTVLDSECPGGGAGACGTCTLNQPRPCFDAGITVAGGNSVIQPDLGANFCVAESTSGSINLAGGLPGPGRVLISFETNGFCDAGATQPYTSPSGVCP